MFISSYYTILDFFYIIIFKEIDSSSYLYFIILENYVYLDIGEMLYSLSTCYNQCHIALINNNITILQVIYNLFIYHSK